VPQPSIWQQIFTPRMLICIFTGFASGLPLYLLLQLVPAWLKDGGVSLAEIGLFALVGLPYTWKFLWSPFLDRYFMASVGRRRTWLIPTQAGLLLSICLLGVLQPESQLQAVVVLCFVIAILSATQDIALDAYRRELLADNELGLGNSIHVNAYRLSGLVPGSLSLILSDHLPWDMVFFITGLFMLLGLGMTLLIKDVEVEIPPRLDIMGAIIQPFREFLDRNGLTMTLQILAFMLLYKLGDNMATALSTPFYMDIGFSKSDIGLVAKHAALWPMIIGGMLGGILMLKIGINRALWLFGIVQMITILGFAVLAEVGHNIPLLALVISMEYLGVGLGTAAFVAFIAKTTNPMFAATQFALLTAFAALPRTIVSAFSGILVEAMGWTHFFLLCTLLAVPGMLMLIWVAPFNQNLPDKN
jgi:MFS transporter, PAT family, beta-lactamase induction signal transducer AmpG